MSGVASFIAGYVVGSIITAAVALLFGLVALWNRESDRGGCA